MFALSGLCGCDGGSQGESSTGAESTGAATDATTDGPAEACAVPTAGPTVHDGELGMNEVWTAEAGPHIVTQWVRVPDGATLTIEPCAEVRMQKDAALVFGHANGTVVTTLRAEGEPDRPIRFVRDGAEPWSAIVAFDPAQLSLAHVTLEGGGSDRFLWNASLVLRGIGETPTRRLAKLVDVTIRDSVGHGVVAAWASGFLPGSSGLTVTDSGNEEFPFPVRVGEHALDSLPDGDYTGNRVDEILIEDEGANLAAGLQEDATLHDRGVPYRVGEWEGARLRVGGGERPMTTLTIEPGVVLRFTPGAAFEVEHWTSDVEPATGAVVALGTAEKPIVFTSAAPSPAPGDWVGLWFGSVPAAHNRIDHARIEYAGGECSCVGFTCTAAAEASVLFIEGVPASGFITNTTFAHGAGHGISRGWRGGGPDFTASNRFEDIAGCAQTMTRDLNNMCPDGDGCG
ncbi:MAG TPA: hypothetical protein VGB85_32670 [Nannocystis sp.]|jgi:hypothetical protein